MAGLSAIRITGNDPIHAAGEEMEFRYQIAPYSLEERENIMIVSADDYEECMPASYYSAHIGVPIII